MQYLRLTLKSLRIAVYLRSSLRLTSPIAILTTPPKRLDVTDEVVVLACVGSALGAEVETFAEGGRNLRIQTLGKVC
jgi:hypothetical protein